MIQMCIRDRRWTVHRTDSLNCGIRVGSLGIVVKTDPSLFGHILDPVGTPDPDTVFAGNAKRGVALVVFRSEDTELAVLRIEPDQVTVHQYP